MPTRVFNDDRDGLKVRVFPVLLTPAPRREASEFPETPRELREAGLILQPTPTAFDLPAGTDKTVSLGWQQFPTGTKVAAIGVVYEGTPTKVQTGAVRNITRLLNINFLSLPGKHTSNGDFTRLRPEEIDKKLYLTARVKNTGDKIDKPREGEMLVRRDSDDKVVFRRTWLGDIVMPGAERDFPIEITKILPAGEYTGKATMRFGSTRRARIIASFRLTGPNQLPTPAFSIRNFNGKGDVGDPAHITGLIDSTGTAPFKAKIAISLFRVGAGESTTHPIAQKAVAFDVQAGKESELATDLGKLTAGSYRVEGSYTDAAGDPQTVTASFEATTPESFFDRYGTLLLILAIAILLLLLAAFLLRRFRRLRREVEEARAGTAAPVVAVPAVEPAAPAVEPAVLAGSGLVDINTAPAGELQRLPGIGPKAAERIVEHREEFGPFKSVDDLAQVEGFGAKRIDGLREEASTGGE